MDFSNMMKLKSIPKFNRECIMVVDDNSMGLELTSILLQDQNLTVETFDSGRKAYEAFRDSKEGHYQMIAMDINMCDMDGFSATEMIRNLDRKDSKSVYIYGFSASMKEDIEGKIQECGMNGYIEKPIDFCALFEEMHRIFQ